MAEITFDPELMQHIKTIYGDAELDGRTLKLIHNTWKANPDWIRNAAEQKQRSIAPKVELVFDDVEGNQERELWRNNQLLNISTNPINETARDDLSAISNFNAAFREAGRRGLRLFRWKSTKANPSGLFEYKLATSTQTNTPQESAYARAKRGGNTRNLVVSDPIKNNVTDSNPTQTNKTANPLPTSSSNASAIPTFNYAGLNNYYRLLDIDRDFNLAYYKYLKDNPSLIDVGSGINLSNVSNHKGYWSAYNKFKNNYTDRGGVFKTGIFGDRFIKRNQQGGTMNNQEELQKAFMAYLIQDAAAQGVQIQSEQDLQAYAQLLGEEGIQAKYQEFMQRMQGGIKARLGAKLEYYRKLKGVCPDGQAPSYYKEGMLKTKCTACLKAKEGNKMNEVEEFRNKRKQINKDQRGSAILKSDTIHVKDPKTKQTKVYDLTKGHKHKQYTQLTNKDYRNLPKNKQTDVDLKDQARKNACGAKMKKK